MSTNLKPIRGQHSQKPIFKHIYLRTGCFPLQIVSNEGQFFTRSLRSAFDWLPNARCPRSRSFLTFYFWSQKHPYHALHVSCMCLTYAEALNNLLDVVFNLLRTIPRSSLYSLFEKIYTTSRYIPDSLGILRGCKHTHPIRQDSKI